MKLSSTKIKHAIQIVFLFFISTSSVDAQQISLGIFGQNAWMPDSIGTARYNGKIHLQWSPVKNSGANTIRFGGIAVDKEHPTMYQYLRMVDSIISRQMEPIIQVPFYDDKFTAENAASIVQFINITHNRNVKYWVIGNEPDVSYGYNNSSQVAPYIKAFSIAMKSADPNIKTMGPETAWYNQNIIDGLTQPGGPDDITGRDPITQRFYIDVFSFHTFPYSGRQKRDDVINYLTSPGGFEDQLKLLNDRISNCNAYHNRTDESAIMVAVTETNVNWKNAPRDNLEGLGASGFIAGQFWAEMMGICMKQNINFLNFWSVIEGNELGYINHTTTIPKPTYYHYQLITQNFDGNYCAGTDNQQNIKAFGSKSSGQVTAIIMNQEESTNYNYTIRLNKSNILNDNPLKINIDAGIAKEFSQEINNQTTIVLIFDLDGNIKSKWEYKLAGNADTDQPPTFLSFVELPEANITPEGPVSFCEGDSVVLNANTGEGLFYQWKKDGNLLTGETTSSYTATLTGSYTVDVSNSNGTSTSAEVFVSANAPSTAGITISASATQICDGSTVIFTAQPVNAGTSPSYQWQLNGNNISGANAETYSSSTLENNDGVSCIMISNHGCVSNPTVTSNTITMAIGQITAVISPAGPITIKRGQNVTLYANTGPDYTYQWLIGDNLMKNATKESHKTNKAGTYTVMVSQGSCSALSEGVEVIVIK